MTDISELRGIWLYRSFLNNPAPVGDFGKLAVWEAELSLDIADGGRLYGFLGERPEVATGNEPYLLVEGEVALDDPIEVRLRATGKPGSEFDGWVYDYAGYLAPAWPNATLRRPVIVGTVTRTVAHGSAPAGSVFSFVAVKRDFVETTPRNSAGPARNRHDGFRRASLPSCALAWCTRRVGRHEPSKEGGSAHNRLAARAGRQGARQLSADRLKNGSGEDFLYMHRRMVQDVRALDPTIRTWARLPQPQFPASFAADTKATRIGNLDGYAVPPAWTIPDDPNTTSWLHELRKTSTLYAKFQAWEGLYTDPGYLATLSLGELGRGSSSPSTIGCTCAGPPSRTIHPPIQPSTVGRCRAAVHPSTSTPSGSCPNTTIWSRHSLRTSIRSSGACTAGSMIASRIGSGRKRSARPGTIKRAQLNGVAWFETDGRWVVHDEPWEGRRLPDDGHGHHGHGGHAGHGGLALDVATMKQALTIIFGPSRVPPRRSPRKGHSPRQKRARLGSSVSVEECVRVARCGGRRRMTFDLDIGSASSRRRFSKSAIWPSDEATVASPKRTPSTNSLATD